MIHGPPGTGKSQTIANIIATLIAEGRRVLFVSEKTAALDVVKRRLAKVGLGGFCLDLHSDRGKKDSVYAQLREALGQPPADPQEFPYERLLARRQELNAIVRALHEIRRPLGLTVFAVHGRVATIHDVPRLNIVVHDVNALNDNRLRRIEEAARRIARRAPRFRDHYTSRWRSLGPVSTSPMLTHEVRADLALIRSAVDSVLDTAASASAACGVDPPETQFEAIQLLRVLAHLKSIPGTIPPPWLEPGGLARALVSTDTLRSEAAERQELFRRPIVFAQRHAHRASISPMARRCSCLTPPKRHDGSGWPVRVEQGLADGPTDQSGGVACNRDRARFATGSVNPSADVAWRRTLP